MKEKKELTPEEKYKREKIKNALLVAAAIGLVVWSFWIGSMAPIVIPCVLFAVWGFGLFFSNWQNGDFEASKAIGYMVFLALLTPMAVIPAWNRLGDKGEYALLDDETLFILIASSTAFFLLVFVSASVIMEKEERIRNLKEANEKLKEENEQLKTINDGLVECCNLMNEELPKQEEPQALEQAK